MSIYFPDTTLGLLAKGELRLLSQTEVHLNFRRYFNWFPIQERWGVAPLLYRFKRRFGQIGLCAGHQIERTDRAVLQNYCLNED